MMKSEKGSFVVVVLLLMLVLMAFISSIFAMNFNNMALSKAYADHKNELFEVDAAGENILRQVDDYLVELDENVHDYMLTEKYSVYNTETIVSEEFQNYLHLNWLERVLLPSIQLKYEQVGQSDLPIDLEDYRGLEINNKINQVIKNGKIYIVDDFLYQDLMEDYYDECYVNLYYRVVRKAIESAGISFINTDYTVTSSLEDIHLPGDGDITSYKETWDNYGRSEMSMVLRLDITNDHVEKPQNLISRLSIVPPFSQEDTYIEFEGISPNPLFGNAISSNGSVIIRDSIGKNGFKVTGDIYSQEGKGELVETLQSDWNSETKSYDKGIIFDGAHGNIYGNVFSRGNIVFYDDESKVFINKYPGKLDQANSVVSKINSMKRMLYKPMTTGGISDSQYYYMDLSNPYFFSDLGGVDEAELKAQFGGQGLDTKLINSDEKGGNVIANGIMIPASHSTAFLKIYGNTVLNDDVVNTSAEMSSISFRKGLLGISKPGDVGSDPRIDDGSTIKVISRDNKSESSYLPLKYNSHGVNVLYDYAVMPGRAIFEDANGKIFYRDHAVLDLFTSQSTCLSMLQGDATNDSEWYRFKLIDRPAFFVNLSTNPNDSARKYYMNRSAITPLKIEIKRYTYDGSPMVNTEKYLRYAPYNGNFSLHYEYELHNHYGWLGGDVFSAAKSQRVFEAAGNYTTFTSSDLVDRMLPGYEESFNILYDSGFLRKKFLAQTENFGYESFDMEESISVGYIKDKPTSETGIMYYPDNGSEQVLNIGHGQKFKGIIFAEGDLRIVGPKVENQRGQFTGTIICLGTLTLEGNVWVNYNVDVIQKQLKDFDLARKFFQKGALPIPWTSVEVEKSNPLMRKKENEKRYEILEWSVNR